MANLLKALAGYVRAAHRGDTHIAVTTDD